jgi:hypothetical protein
MHSQMVKATIGHAEPAHRSNFNVRDTTRSADPTMGQHLQSSMMQARDPMHQTQKAVNFREAWKKAVEKYSPTLPTRLNDVSIRFQAKLLESGGEDRKANS